VPRFKFTVPQALDGLRLDQCLAHEIPELSRGKAKKVLAVGGVFLNKKRVKVAGRLVREGQKIEVHTLDERALPNQESAPRPVIPIVSQTDNYIVVDKPSGLFSAPTPETDQNDLVHFLEEDLHASGALSAGKHLHLIHRLDRPTSGLMVLAMQKTAAAALSKQVAEHTMDRVYWALLAGEVHEATSVNLPIAQRQATTHFEPIEVNNGISLVEARLETGRTHQVRIHAESLGAPVAGDSKYGRRILRGLSTRPPRLALHARALSFVDPAAKKKVEFQSDFPEELRSWAENSSHQPA